MTPTAKTIEELEFDLAEAERIAAGIREQLERARWVREYEEAEEEPSAPKAIAKAALIADLNASFPGIAARPAPAIHGSGAISVCGLALMPDGLPIFSDLYTDSPEYDGSLHTAFSAWCEARGWYVEPYDGERLDLVPIADAISAVNAWASAWPERASSNLLSDCPF